MKLSEYIRLLQEIEFEHGDLDVLDYHERFYCYTDEVSPEVKTAMPIGEKHGTKYYKLSKEGIKVCLI